MVYDMSQKTLFKILTNNGMKVRFMNGLNDIKKCVELKSVHFKKKSVADLPTVV